MLGALRDRIAGSIEARPLLSFPYEVFKKFSGDRGGQQAALLAYYGFFSLFPLLLIAVTVLGFVLRNNPDLEETILNSALAQFPIIGAEISRNIHAIGRNGAGLLIGVVGALWGGLGGVRALQNAMDHVWGIALPERASTIRQVVRGVATLFVLAVFTAVSLGLSTFGAATERFGFIGRTVTVLLGALVNAGVFAYVFRFLTVADVSWRDVLPGAVLAGAAWAVLQSAGAYIVAHQLARASELYGFFAIVLGLLSWMYLGAQVTLFSAEVNVVAASRRGRPGAPGATVELSHTQGGT